MNHQALTIRPATLNDLPAIVSIGTAAFHDTYGGFLPPEQVTFDINRDYSPEAFKAQMEERNHQFILLEEAQTVLGFASFSPHGEKESWFYLHKLYLQPNLKAKGYGRKLLENILHLSKAQGAKAIELTVNRKNPAVGFYTRMGFEIIQEQDFHIGNDFWRNDYVMAKYL